MVKRLFFVLMLMTIGLAGAWADEVSEKDAQALAKSFVNSYFGRKGGSGPNLQGQMEKLGFYVFNMTDKGGFVIVSNESETTPILGYSETGSIELDPDKMPENMRNWLQGYADEIAWLQKQENYGKIVKKSVNKARTRAVAKENITNTILLTRWNQRAPYNNQCPDYSSGNRSVTGCVATAMAQVMKYHEWPNYQEKPNDQSHLQPIPAYTTDSYKISLLSLPAVYKFDWANMLTSYSGDYNDTEATAVATLMKYCGYSVEMDYGPSSGSNSINVADALKSYYDYMSTTTCITRSFYTYDKWVEIIYDELAHNRPVVYGGQSSGGGHEFVCDGYKYENGTDYFHINWGWGGKSDDYYVLSSLNPYAGQGAGGSTSNDGFHYGQDAVVGIQPSTRTGQMSEMMDITPNVFNLTMNGMTLSHSSVVVNTEVTATLNITNNNSIDYDGDIFIGYINNNALYLLEGDCFSIPARKTQDCVIKFKPNGTGTYNLVLCLPNDNGGYTSDCTVWASLPVVEANSGIPTNLAVTDISSNSAQLSWTENGSATSWEVGYKAGDSNYTIVTANTNPYNLTELASETQYTVKVRPSGGNDGTWSPELSFTTIAAYPVPENLTVSEITPTSAKISWTGNADRYDLRYVDLPDCLEAEPKWLQYDDGNCLGGLGSGSETDNTRTWGVLYPGTEVTGNKLTKVMFYVNEVAEITMKIYSGGDTPGTPIQNGTIVVTPQGTGFNEVTLNSLSITPGQNLWITLTESSKYPMAICNSSEPNNKWRYNGYNWVKNTDSYGWMIRGYIESDINALAWSGNVKCNNSPYTLEGLAADNNYAVQVRSDYGSDHYSGWVTATISKALELGNEETKNTVLIESWNSKTTNVTLKDRTLYKDGSWNTLCLPFSLTAEQLAASPLANADIRTLSTASFSNGELTLNFTAKDNVNSITAGTPYIIKWTKASNYEEANAQTRDIINPVFSGVEIDKTINDIKLDLDNGRSVTFKGAYTPVSFDQTNHSILFLGDNNKLYFPKSGAKINSCRAYFELNGFEMVDVAQARMFVGDSNATGIISIDKDNKIIVNESEGWYSLDGRKLSGKPTNKGVYIQNGRKVVIK